MTMCACGGVAAAAIGPARSRSAVWGYSVYRSELTISAMPGPSSGRAVAMPPATSSGSASREYRIEQPNAEPSPRRSTIISARCATFTIRSVKPAATRRSICQTMSGLPPTSSSGLGTLSESGRIRSPRPAARIIAFMPSPSERVASNRAPVLEDVEELQERRELAVARARRAKIAHHARHVGEIGALAVAVPEPREDAQHLDLPLHAHPFEIAPE